MPDGIDFLMRPVYHGMIRYTDLKDSSLTLEDIFLMNVYLDNQKYNESVLERERWRRHE
ncbi:DUF6889 family protein [Turicimonas muris]|uniref:DUF6889 family protein n=1 Tax=Turicimonas muris TaxID=1796652 RepID=UPI0025731A1D|nr:hypothetical protein [Turicimonas muris]